MQDALSPVNGTGEQGGGASLFETFSILNEHAELSPLARAAALGRVSDVSKFLAGGEDPLRLQPVPGGDRGTALHIALMFGQPTTAKVLLKHSPSLLNTASARGQSPFVTAVRSRNQRVEMLEVLHSSYGKSMRSLGKKTFSIGKNECGSRRTQDGSKKMRLALCCFPFCGIIETLKNRPESKQSPVLGTWTSVEDGEKGRISNGFLNVALSQDAHCLFPAPKTEGRTSREAVEAVESGELLRDDPGVVQLKTFIKSSKGKPGEIKEVFDWQKIDSQPFFYGACLDVLEWLHEKDKKAITRMNNGDQTAVHLCIESLFILDIVLSGHENESIKRFLIEARQSW